MSNFIESAVFKVLSIKDRRLQPNYQVIRRERDRIVERKHATEMPSDYKNAFWPGNAAVLGGASSDVLQGVWSRPMSRIGHGEASRLGFVGITRDQNGNILGGVTCSLFLTATRAWIMDVVSDANGAFLLQTFYSPDTHFIVFWKAGAPNLFDTTDQTLQGY